MLSLINDVFDMAKIEAGRVALEVVAFDRGALVHDIIDMLGKRAEEAALISSESAQGKVVGLESGQADYRILIVEDQLENQLLLQRLLKDAGFTVKVAENGAEGVALFQSFRPHFIWMDRRMPVMDGLEATQCIRSLPGGKDVKIAAVTASAFAEQREEMLSAGMDDFVRKPYRPAEIFDCMTRQLGVHFVHVQAVQVEADSALPSSSLAKLPEILRRELGAGLVLGNTRPACPAPASHRAAGCRARQSPRTSCDGF
ncbi:response regulator [Candidatus Methylospira mobilis]|uniref:response regulator n=1 Tax=Candidatus Methylospira mobilis TaxID=1808979 RepID=UPI001D176151|nr:response regulator [Candidatus Methylospira mobilis]WNV04861.1 response regulator [Candidatus Methylospira mobilis]